MNLTNYYTNVLSTLGLHTTEDGFITIDAAGKQIWTNAGKSIVLPTEDHIKTLLSEDDDGKPVINKILFNPLDENVIRGDSVSIKKLKEASETRLSYSTVVGGSMLLSLATLKKHPNVPMYIQSFLANLKNVVTTSNMVAVDDKSIELWNKLYAAGVKQKVSIVKVYVKKGGIDKSGVKHNRLATMTFPLYDLLCEAGDSKSVLGVTLRNKDIKVFKLIHEFLFKQDGVSKVEFSSDDGESPAFISLMSLYVREAKFPNKVINALKFIDQELYDSGYVNVNMSTEDMDVGNTFARDLLKIPTNVDVNKTLQTPQQTVVPELQPQRDYKTADMTPATYNPAPQQQVTEQQPVDSNASSISKILYGNGGGFNQPAMVPAQQQQVVMPQQQMTQQQRSVPMGIDSVPQQMVMQQQAYQPNQMQQQPMYQPNQMPMQQQSIPIGINTMGGQQQPMQQNYNGGVYQPNQAVYNPYG